MRGPRFIVPKASFRTKPTTRELADGREPSGIAAPDDSRRSAHAMRLTKFSRESPGGVICSHADGSDSDEPESMRHLTDAQKDDLGVLLERYLESLESGLPPTVESLTQGRPDLREPLRECVGGLETLHQLAGGESATNERSKGERSNSHSFSDLELTAGEPLQRLGDFDLHEEIGRGGMGVVYRATQVSLHRTVAVKILPLASILDPRQLTRFQHEAEAAASLLHQNIVPVFAIGCQRGVHFYAMQHIEGRSLDQWIDSGDAANIHWKAIAAMAADVADGLHAAHEYGIVHRDIKPSNLMLDPSGKAWITDFGLARIQSNASVTQSGDVVGTMRYMSPEQSRGESALVDGRSDVYSLAATLYEMLTLQPAHEGGEAPTILRTIDEGSIKPLRRHRTDLPRDLETVVMKAISSQRDARYETAAQFAEDLRRVVAGEATIARPPTIVDQVIRAASRHRTAVLATAMVGLVAVIGFAIATAKLAAAKQVSDAHATQSQNSELMTRDAIDRVGTQIAELLSEIPAAENVRHQLLQETLTYYQQFASAPVIEGISTRRRTQDLAITFGKIGVLQSELGEYDSAVKSLQTSEQHYQLLATENENDRALQLSWSISQNNLAKELSRVGDSESAAKWFTLAVAKQKRLRKDGVDDATAELAKTLNNLAAMLADTNHSDMAKDAWAQAIEILDQPSMAEAGLRATIQSNLAGLLAKQEPVLAAKLARESLADQLSRLETDSSDPKLATEAIVTLNTLASALSESSDHQAALASLRQAVKIGRQLNTRWPDQSKYRHDLVISLNALGMSLSALERFDPAMLALQQAAQHARKLESALTHDAEVQSMLGGVLNNLGFLQQQLGDKEAAMQCFHEAVTHQQIAAKLAPAVPRYQAFLDKHQYNLNRLRGDS